MSKQKVCNMDCFNCLFSDCINRSNSLSETEVKFSVEYETSLKAERREEVIRQIDDPTARANAKYRNTPKGKEMVHRMNTNDLAKKRYKKYEQSEKGKERRKRHEAKPERIAYRKAYMKEYMKEYNKVYRERKRKEREELEHNKDE